MVQVEEKAGLSVNEAASYIGIGRNTMWGLVWDGTVPHCRFGRRVIVSRRALDRLLDGEQVSVAPPDSKK